MRGLLSRVLAIGAVPADDEDTRLRKLLLLVTAVTMTPLAVLWGLLSWVSGNTVAALIPWAYAVVSFIGLVRSPRHADTHGSRRASSRRT